MQLADHPPLLQLVDLDHGVQELEVVAGVGRQLLQRQRVLRKAGAAEADPRAQEARADPAVEADALGDRTTSAPVASQTFAISLMNEIRVIRAALAASLIISADATSAAHDRRLDAVVQRRDGVAVLVRERADDDPVRDGGSP